MLAAASTKARMYYSHRAGQFDYQLLRRLRYRLTGIVVGRSFAALAGNTRHAADAAAMLFGLPRTEIGVVYNGLDWSLLAPDREAADVRAELSIPPGSVVFGTSGNLRALKRVDLALQALRRAGAPTALVVIGDGPERSALERLASELSLTDQVRFTGATVNVTDYLQVLDAFLLLSGPEESFGNSAVEAMGLGIPTIVMHDGGGLTEHVEHEMTGVVATDVGDLGGLDRAACVGPGAQGPPRAECARERPAPLHGRADDCRLLGPVLRRAQRIGRAVTGRRRRRTEGRLRCAVSQRRCAFRRLTPRWRPGRFRTCGIGDRTAPVSRPALPDG